MSNKSQYIDFNHKISKDQLVKLNRSYSHHLQGAPYVFERFLEAALRPWIDSDKNFVNKKIALAGIYLLRL